MTNKYGRNLHGIKDAAGHTKGLCPDGCHYTIYYDTVCDDVRCIIIQDDWSDAWWIASDPDRVRTIGHSKNPLTMQNIADMVEKYMSNPFNFQ